MRLLQEQDLLDLIEKYIRTAVRSDVRKYGHLPGCFCQDPCEDVVQQVHVYLCELLGGKYLQQIAGAISAQPLEFKDTPEYEVLAKTITRAIGKSRWTFNKRKERGLPQEVPLPKGCEGVQLSESRVVEMTADLLLLFNSWNREEQQVWQGSSLGKTTRQLEKELGMAFQRVAEMRKRLLNAVAFCLEKTGGGHNKCPS
jgi:hypothetical protein